MLDNTWYFSTIRKYTANFADLFNGLYIRKFNKEGEVLKTIQVPVSFAGKEKWYVREVEEYNSETKTKTKVKQTLPRIGFNLKGFSYDPSRKSNRGIKFKAVSENNHKGYQLTPAPYNFEYALYIATDSIDELLQIIEQIIPYFQPDYHMKIYDNPAKPTEYSDISVALTSVSPTIEYEGTMDTQRMVTCELSFMVQGFIYSPVVYQNTGGGENSGLIKHVMVNIYPQTTSEIINAENKDPIEIYQGYVDPLAAEVDDDYEIVEKWYNHGEEVIKPEA